MYIVSLCLIAVAFAACSQSDRDGDLYVTISNGAARFDAEPESPTSPVNELVETSPPAVSPTPSPAATPPVAPAAPILPSRPPAIDETAMGDPQRPGDPVLGRELLVNNGTEEVPYQSCGIPEAFVRLGQLDRDWDKALKIADRRDAELPYDLSYAKRPSGVRVIATNCLMCHAGKLGGRLIIGLPDVNRDYTQPDGLVGLSGAALRLTSRIVLRPESQVELGRILRIADAVRQYPRPDTIGLNPADGWFGALTTHRDPITLAWRDSADRAAGPVPKRLIFTDVPALWNTHRRSSMFYTGFVRGDHARVMMTSALLCVENADEAARIDAYFPHVQAYIETLRAPRFEQIAARPIDAVRAEHGRPHYERLCKSCHGGRDGEGSEPLPFVPLDKVGTDPIYAEVTKLGSDLPEAQTIAYFFEFFNRSWYGMYGSTARLVRPTELGYAAPPLDGIWATAPYFHNGSVPTLDAVLDVDLRPTIFKRSFEPDNYDFERLGWPHESVTQKGGDPAVYDTTQLGRSNRGHSFGSELSDDARRDLLEYLKTF